MNRMRIFCAYTLSYAMLVILLLLQYPVNAQAATVKSIKIYIEQQKLVAFENDKEVYTFDVVTGKSNKETTLGKYHISRKHEEYTSKTYGSEMPYSMFFSADGKAIHGTHMATLRSYLHAYVNESVGSEGCVGLTDDNAKALFEWAPVGIPVIVLSDEP